MNRHELAPGMAWDSDAKQLLTIPTPGAKFFVDPDKGDDDGESDFGDPVKTIMEAHSRVVSGRGDSIILKNYPFDSIDFLENLVISKAGIRLYPAFPCGNARYPTIAPTTGKAISFTGVGAFGFYCEYVRFYSPNDVAAQIASDGARFYRADFSSLTTHGVVLVGQATDGSNTGSGMHLEQCMARECGGNGIRQGGALSKDVFATNVNIWDCQFYGNVDADIEDEGEALKSYWHQWDIGRNKFMDKNKALYLDMDGGIGLRSMLHRNYFAGAVNTDTVKLVAGIVSVGNRGTNGLVDTIPAP